MRSFQEAQRALVSFDQVHWHHERGAESVVHTYLHLTEALFRKFAHEAEGLHQDLLFKHWVSEMVPRLVEHALRLAHHCEFDLEEEVEKLFARSGSSVIQSLPQSWYDVYTEMTLSRSHDRWPVFKDYVRSLGEALHPLASICERLGHGENLDSEKCKKVASVAASLMSHALLFLLLASGRMSEEAIQKELMTVFEQRLTRLSEYFEYVS